MLLIHKLDAPLDQAAGREGESAGSAFAPVLGLLLFLWLLSGALLAVVIFTPQQGSGATLPQLENLLPADQHLWSGFAA